MAKLCKTDKSAKPSEAGFECRKCGRLAKKEEKVCKPEKLKKG